MTILRTRFCKSAVLSTKRQDLVCKIDVKREKNWRLFSSSLLTLEDHRKPSKVFRLRKMHRIMISYKYHYTINKGFEEKSTPTLNPFVDRNRAQNRAFYGKNRLVLRSSLFQMVKTACSKLSMFLRYLRSKFTYLILYVVYQSGGGGGRIV